MNEQLSNKEELTAEAHAHLHEQGIPHVHDEAHTHADGQGQGHGHHHENTKAVLNRLSRIIGHLQAVRRMVEDDRDCAEVLVQLAAVRSALDGAGRVILQDHMQHCIVEAVQNGDQKAIDDLCRAIDRFMG